MRQFRTNIGSEEGVAAGLQCNWEYRQQAWEHRQQVCEHLGVPSTYLEMQVTFLGAPPITVEQCGKNIIVFGNAAGRPEDHIYYILFNNI
jgi:hypothetical protein